MEYDPFSPLQWNGTVLFLTLSRTTLSIFSPDFRDQKFVFPVLIPQHKFTEKIS